MSLAPLPPWSPNGQDLRGMATASQSTEPQRTACLSSQGRVVAKGVRTESTRVQSAISDERIRRVWFQLDRVPTLGTYIQYANCPSCVAFLLYHSTFAKAPIPISSDRNDYNETSHPLQTHLHNELYIT